MKLKHWSEEGDIGKHSWESGDELLVCTEYCISPVHIACKINLEGSIQQEA